MSVKNVTILLISLFLSVNIFAQKSGVAKAKRIDFVKEKSNSLVWEEKVAAHKTKSFVFHAKKGQKLFISIIDDTNKGSFDFGKVSIEPNTDFEQPITVSKDYNLFVTNNDDKATSFRISISLSNPSKAKSK